MKKTVFFWMLTLPFIVSAQVGVGTVTVDANALIELKSGTNSGGLILSTVALDTRVMASPFSSHVEGMTVYNTATSVTEPQYIFPGMYYDNGSSWVRMGIADESPAIGDIKQSFIGIDADGWYMMNGRLLSSLPIVAAANATNLGFSTNLPNAAAAILKGKTGIEILGAVGGSTSFTIAQANLPAINYTGNTTSAGAHSHSYSNRGGTLYHAGSGSNGGLRFSDGETRTTGSAGDHSHTISAPSGGSGTAITFIPKHLVVQTFIYLGN